MEMSEDKRYVVKGSDDFFLHIEDTTFTEDAHEGAIYNIYQVVRRLNEQDERIRELEQALDNFKPIIFKSEGEDMILYTTDGDWND